MHVATEFTTYDDAAYYCEAHTFGSGSLLRLDSSEDIRAFVNLTKRTEGASKLITYLTNILAMQD